MFIYMAYKRQKKSCQNIISKPLGSFHYFATVKSVLDDIQHQISSEGRVPVHQRSSEGKFKGDRNLIFPQCQMTLSFFIVAIVTLLLKKYFYWSIGDFQIVLISGVHQCESVIYTYIHLSITSGSFPIQINYRVLSRVPSAITQALVSCLSYLQQCVYGNIKPLIYPSLQRFPLGNISQILKSECLSLFCK